MDGSDEVPPLVDEVSEARVLAELEVEEPEVETEKDQGRS